MKLIAEAGTAHNGDLVYARELIDVAAEAGAAYIKFQYVIANEILHKKTPPILLFDAEVNLYERFVRLEQGPAFYAELVEYAKSKQIDFLCTPFGIKSAQYLLDIGLASFKIASPELNHFPLLTFINRHQLPVFISTGLAYLSDIEESLGYLNQCATTLLHCVTSYPAPEEDYALSCIPHLSALFSVAVGCSDHSLDCLIIPLLAQYYGASHLEKHITLSRQGKGLDDPIAITPPELNTLCQESRELTERLDSEGPAASMRYLEDRFTKERIQRASGTGSYKLSPQEKKTYYTSRRSILALTTIEAGQHISEKNCAVLRAEQNGLPGLHPRYLNVVLGKIARKPIHPGEGITWDAFL